MLTRATPKQLKALWKLSNQPEWQEISTLLADELDAIYKHLVSSPDEVTLRRMQGRAQFVHDFRELARDALKTLERLRESTL